MAEVKVGAKVKPAAQFNFDLFSGPSSLESIGEIIAIEPANGEVFKGIVFVKWDNGAESDHACGEYKGSAVGGELQWLQDGYTVEVID